LGLSEITDFQLRGLSVIENGQPIGRDLSRLLFGYCVGRILFTGLKDVFQLSPSFAAPRYRKSSTESTGISAKG
jgi:hypothetical protein